MVFWIICAAMTFAAVLAVLRPFMHTNVSTTDTISVENVNDLEVYKDQLREIGEDLARGQISKDDAEEARLEMSRRILKLDHVDGKLARGAHQVPGRIVAISAALAVPLVTWVAYGYSGSPQFADQPFAARLAQAPGQASIEELIARTEQHLAANPNDGKGWDVVAPVYLRTGQYEKAVGAYRKSKEILGSSAKREIGLGEALVGLSDGIINDDAFDAFNRASGLAPEDPQPRIYIATAMAQKGKYAEAKAAFEQLLTTAPADAPWRAVVEQYLGQLADARKAPAAQPAPTQDDVENAASMSATDRQAMIEQMVAGLDAKLKDNPSDKDGWLRLIRSYAILNKRDDAEAALSRAREGLTGQDQALSQIKALAVELGLEKQ